MAYASVDLGGTALEIVWRPQGWTHLLRLQASSRRHRRTCLRSGSASSSLDAGVEQPGVLRADGQRLAVLDGVEEDVVAQDVALDGLDEGLAAAFQPLEQVRAAEAHQPLAGAGQVLQ